MEQHFVGLDVSLEMTSVCVLDEAGVTIWRGKVASTPEALAAVIGARAPHAVRIDLETGPLCTWHWHALRALKLSVVCLDARHAKTALSMQLNKIDANDAHGLAQIVRTGWYKEVTVKSLDSHRIRISVLWQVGESHSIVGQHGMDGIEEGLDDAAEELGTVHLSSVVAELDVGELWIRGRSLGTC